MKKLSLSKQLFIIYSIVLLAITLIFFSLLSGWLIEVFVDVNYNKLDDFAHTLETMLDEGVDVREIEFNNKIEYVIWSNDDQYYYTEDLHNILSDEYIENLYYKIVTLLETEEYYRSTLDTIDDYFYATIKTDSGYYILTASSGLLLGQMRQETGAQITLLFILILVGGGSIIMVWSNSLVDRITKITTHVSTLKSTNYSLKHIDHANDEIGGLSLRIDDMRQQIYDNEETKREILQNLSHDIKTPLAVIKSYAEAIIDGVETPESAQLIIKQSNILQNKVEKLLQLNRLNYLENDRTYETIYLKELIQRVVGSTKYLSNIQFELDLDESVFYGYEENFQTVIENIISNAIRYAKTKVVITLKSSKLSFYNDGEHIEDKFLSNGFKAYEMGSKGEFGVGMSIVEKTIEFFNLDFIVINEEVGVTFIIADTSNKNNVEK